MFSHRGVLCIYWNSRPVCVILSYIVWGECSDDARILQSRLFNFIMYKNVLLTIEYDGTGFSGWQRQPEARTVQGTVEKVLTELVGEQVVVDGVSRTDAGVHARDQKALFCADLRIPVEKLAKVMNDRLQGRPESRADNDDVRIVSADEVPAGFNLRGSVAGKTYRYSIRCAAEMPVFDRNYRYHIHQNLDAERMREAAEFIKGTHDFNCFQAAGGEPGKTTVRTISDIRITEERVSTMQPGGEENAKMQPGGEKNAKMQPGGTDDVGEAAGTDARDIHIDITGDGFLYNMVRIITGTLVEVGLGKREPVDLRRIIDSRDRAQAGHTAPPQGLCLMKVYFEKDRLDR